MMTRLRMLFAAALACAPATSPARPAPSAPVVPAAQVGIGANEIPGDSGGRLTIDAVFKDGEYRGASLPSIHWMKDGHSYVDTRPDSAGGSDIVRVDLITGEVTVMADAATLMDAARDGARIEVEDITLSDDETRALLYHSSVRVWRQNTRGRYHVIDFTSGTLTPISTLVFQREKADSTQQTLASDSGLQMFAKFSPDGRRVAFVRGNNLWVTDLATGDERQLTTDGSADIINGTSDWVYEEELDLRDAFRWSPDGRRIAYWRFDQSPVRLFPIVDQSTLYPTIATLRYPKAGEQNSRVRVGVLDLAGGATRWLDVGSDTGQYIPRMEWVGNDSLVLERMPRRQNRVDLLMASANTGGTRLILTDRDSAYVRFPYGEPPIWLDGGRRFLWASDRTGWHQIFLYERSGQLVRQLTADGSDVLSILGVDEERRQVYVLMAAPSPTQRQVYRVPLAGGAAERVTATSGSHSATIGPGARFLVDFHSSASTPTRVTLHELPSMRERRVLADNAELASKVQALSIRTPEFFRIPMPDGVELDAYRIVPADFDSTQRYPVLMYVYGGPASPTVVDSWGGSRYLYHQYLAQQGYIVVSVDNRGAAWRGRDFRKITQLNLGEHESRDQIDAARWLGMRSWVDPARIGIWGWSYGGYLSALTAGKGGDVFDAAVVVAPVTDWRLYDTIYTERFMWLPSQNADGYRTSAPQNHVENLSAQMLIVHGTGDDNVHPQNTFQYVDALEAAGKPFYMLLYPNRTHSISGGNSQAHLYHAMSRFLIDNL